MARQRYCRLLFAAAVIVSVTSLSGCSLVLFFGGMAMDAGAADKQVSLEDLALANTGETIEVYLKDGKIRTGVYCGTRRDRPDAYGERYERWRRSASDPASIPPLGEELVIMKASETQSGVTGRLLGLDPRTILILRSSGTDTINVWMPALMYVFDTTGHKINLERIRGEMKMGAAPLMSNLSLVEEGKTNTIPLEEVNHIQLSPPRMNKWKGLAIGAAVDAAFIAYALYFNGIFSW